MNAVQSKSTASLIVRVHVESGGGGKLRVVRLEPSKEGKRLLTSSSVNIPTDDSPSTNGKRVTDHKKEFA